jgi:hypothetical protein
MTWIKNYQLQKTWTASGAPIILGLLTSSTGAATFVMVNTSTGATGTYTYIGTTTGLQPFTTDITGINPIGIADGNNNSIQVTSTSARVRISGFVDGTYMIFS